MRHRRVRHRVDHQRAVLDDACLLVLLAHHVTGRVVQEQQGCVGLVRQLDELGGLLRLGVEQHALRVGQDPYRVTVYARPAGDQRRSVQRLELVEVAPVNDPGDDLARVERCLQVGWDDAEQGLVAEQRFSRATMRRPMRIASCSSAAK